MVCNEKWETMIQQYLDGDLNEPEEKELLSHIKICSDCNTLFEDLKMLADILPEISKEPPFDLIPEALRKNRTKQRYKKFALSTVAAVFVLFMVGLSQVWVDPTASVTATEVVQKMNKTLQQLDGVEIQVEHTYFTDSKKIRIQEHQILKKPNRMYFSRKNLESHLPHQEEDFKYIKNGYEEYREFSIGNKIIQKEIMTETMDIVSWYYRHDRIKDAADIIKGKIHKELIETTYQERPVYKIKFNDVVRNETQAELNFIETEQLVWIDKETSLPLKTEWYKEGAIKPFKVSEFKKFETEQVDESLLTLPSAKKKSAEWKKVDIAELKEKLPKLAPPQQIGEWKAIYYAINESEFSKGGVVGVEYQKGSNRIYIKVARPYTALIYNDVLGQFRQVSGVPYNASYEDFWMSKLAWQDSKQMVLIEGTVPIQELHQIAMEIRNQDELRKQMGAQKTKIKILKELKATDQDIITERNQASNQLESYKADYLIEYNKPGDHPLVNRVIDLYRGPYERHIEVHPGDKLGDDYSLLVKNSTEQLTVNNNPNSWVEVNKEVPPSLSSDAMYLDVEIYAGIPRIGGPVTWGFSSVQAPMLIKEFKEEIMPKGLKLLEKSNETIMGHEAIKYHIKGDYGGENKEFTYWIDKETKLTLKAEIKDVDKSITTITALSLKINPKINDRTFKVPNYTKYMKVKRGNERYGTAGFVNYQKNLLVVKKISLEEAREKTNFQLLVPKSLQGGQLANVWAGFNDKGEIGVVYLDYRFPGRKTLLIEQKKVSHNYTDWEIKQEIIGANHLWNDSDIPYVGNIVVKRFVGFNEGTNISIESTIDKVKTRSFIKSIK